MSRGLGDVYKRQECIKTAYFFFCMEKNGFAVFPIGGDFHVGAHRKEGMAFGGVVLKRSTCCKDKRKDKEEKKFFHFFVSRR